MARGSDERHRANLGSQNYRWIAPRPGQKSHHDQVLESAQRYRRQMEPDLTTRWRSFWSWALINDHVRLALVVILVPLIAALLAIEAYRLEGVPCWSEIGPLWQVVLGCGGLALILLTITLSFWCRWERKVRLSDATCSGPEALPQSADGSENPNDVGPKNKAHLPRTSPESPTAETERIPPSP